MNRVDYKNYLKYCWYSIVDILILFQLVYEN